MTTNVTADAICLHQKIRIWIDEYIAKTAEPSFPLPLPSALQNEFFQFVDKINLGLMEDADNFYGYFLFQMTKKIRLDISSPTAVNFKKAKYVIYFNPLIFLTLTPAQMESSISHEILHIVSLHLLRARDLRTTYSRQALNLAMDIVVNTYLQNLPSDAVSLKQINRQYSLYLPAFESLEYYADELQKALDARTKTSDKPDESLPPSPEMISTIYDPVTTHDLWDESDDLDDQTLTAFTEKYVDAAYKGPVSLYLENMIETLKTQAHELPWSWYLKKMVGTIAAEQRKTTTRRNRRQPERLDLPGRLRNHKAKIFIALDISGSISDAEFYQAMREVLQIIQCYHHDITIIECDDMIRRTYPVKSVRDVQDRLNISGGTSFSPVFEYANSKKIDLLVYFTDGKGEKSLRVSPKGYKVLWIISGQGDDLSVSPAYGIVKKLNPLKEKDTTLDSYDVEKGGYSMNHQEEINMNFDYEDSCGKNRGGT